MHHGRSGLTTATGFSVDRDRFRDREYQPSNLFVHFPDVAMESNSPFLPRCAVLAPLSLILVIAFLLDEELLQITSRTALRKSAARQMGIASVK
jgi:hypothetical protein